MILIYNDTIYNDTVYNDTVYNDTVYNDTIYNNTIYNNTIYNDTIYNDTISLYTIYNDTIYNDTVYNDTVLQNIFAICLVTENKELCDVLKVSFLFNMTNSTIYSSSEKSTISSDNIPIYILILVGFMFLLLLLLSIVIISNFFKNVKNEEVINQNRSPTPKIDDRIFINEIYGYLNESLETDL